MLRRSEDCVHDDNREDYNCAFDISREHRNNRRNNQDYYKQIRKLAKENLQNRFSFALFKLVMSVLSKQFFRLLRGQTFCGYAHFFENIFSRHLIPTVHVNLRLLGFAIKKDFYCIPDLVQ